MLNGSKVLLSLSVVLLTGKSGICQNRLLLRLQPLNPGGAIAETKYKMKQRFSSRQWAPPGVINCLGSRDPIVFCLSPAHSPVIHPPPISSLFLLLPALLSPAVSSIPTLFRVVSRSVKWTEWQARKLQK